MREGRCLCGAVRFRGEPAETFGICHCKMCQRWAGGPLIAATVTKLEIEGADEIVTRRTSGWASRSHCGTCGSALWYRWDKGVDGAGDYEIPLGLWDDADGLTLVREIFVDLKPDAYDFAGDHERLTAAQTLAKYVP